METKKRVAVTPLMEEVKLLIDNGKNVLLPVEGRSMLPFIVGGRDSVELHPVQIKGLRTGDTILARTTDGRYVIHRIVTISNGRLTLEGDGNINLREQATLKDVIARAEYVTDRQGSRRSLTDRKARRLWKIWSAFRPIRKYLLGIYQRLFAQQKQS
ncbi:MAG: S24/S26 family peptidase [Phocaeicola plebeius]|nr:S24/S26 family peptidase [Phocaeicola plebeius]